MKHIFASVLMVDAAYKLNELRMPLYLMLVVDRWTISYMRDTFRNKKGNSTDNSSVERPSVGVP